MKQLFNYPQLAQFLLTQLLHEEEFELFDSFLDKVVKPNIEICFATLIELHFGQFSESSSTWLLINSSNSFKQSVHLYSKIGIVYSSCRDSNPKIKTDEPKILEI